MSRFAAVPTAALDDERLEALHIRVLTALCSYADKDGWCRVGQDKIALRARTNPSRVSQCIKDLSDWGWLRRQRVGKMKVNVYQVLMDCELDASIDLPTEQEQIADTASQVTCPPSKSQLPPEQITLAPTANPIRTPLSNTVPNTASSSDARANAIDRILNACGPGMLDPTKSASPLLDLRARVGRWLEVWDLETEILPVVEAKTSRLRKSRPMSHFGFIEEDIAVFHAKRVSKTPEVEIFDVNANLSGGEPRRRGPGSAGQPAARYASGGHGAFGAGQSGRGSIADSAIRRHLHRQNGNGVPGGDERGSDLPAEGVIVDGNYRLVG